MKPTALQPVAAIEPLLDDPQAEAGAQRSRRPFGADDPGEALERALRIGQPVAVVELDTWSLRHSSGMFEGPKVPGCSESGSVFQLHSDRAPFRTGRPSSWRVTTPSTPVQLAAFAVGTLGTAPMSA